MKTLGLIGRTLKHSFSKRYFEEKFQKENISGFEYHLFELPSIEHFPQLFDKHPNLEGINVTIPYKLEIKPFLQEFDHSAQKVGAVNVVKKLKNGTLKGYNSDYYGFKKSLEQFIGTANIQKALVLGTGGASQAVIEALKDLNISPQYVSRTANDTCLSYGQITAELIQDYPLIINCTPLGTYPKVEDCPSIPYEALTEQHFLYDLVYNPEVTTFMKKGQKQGAQAMNGLPMLILQAEKSWEIWNTEA